MKPVKQVLSFAAAVAFAAIALPAAAQTVLNVNTARTTITPTLIGGGLGTIAFASSRSGLPQIYVMNSDGTEQRAITTEIDGACQPDWSPDGLKIVYVSPCRLKDSDYPGANLHVMNADGTGREPLGGSIEVDARFRGRPVGATSRARRGRKALRRERYQRTLPGRSCRSRNSRSPSLHTA